jgi:hypothetical protein
MSAEAQVRKDQAPVLRRAKPKRTNRKSWIIWIEQRLAAAVKNWILQNKSQAAAQADLRQNSGSHEKSK